ncbi:hypothetical protein D3C73_1249400 [compost metagenome]
MKPTRHIIWKDAIRVHRDDVCTAAKNQVLDLELQAPWKSWPQLCDQELADQQGSDTEQQGEQTKIQWSPVFASQYEQQQVIHANHQQACGDEHFSGDFQICPDR